MTEPHIKQYAAELAELENASPAAIELYLFEAIAVISVVQLGSRHPSVAADDDDDDYVDDDDDDYVDDDEHNFSGTGIQLCRQDYPEDEEMSDEDAIALYGDNYGPVVKEKFDENYINKLATPASQKWRDRSERRPPNIQGS